MVKPGEIYWADVPDAARRPVVVVSRESFNRGDRMLVIPLTTAQWERRRHLPNCVPFLEGEFGLQRNCVAQAERLSLLYHADIDHQDGMVGQIDPQRLRDIIRAIGHVLDAECEPA